MPEAPCNTQPLAQCNGFFMLTGVLIKRQRRLSMNAKIERIDDEIVKTKSKINSLQSRLRELERQKKETENAEIVALVRGIDIAPDELRLFIKTYQEKDTLAPKQEAVKEEKVDA
jgi:hypothetical protein